MKILVFSDWRTQTYEMLREMVKQNNPDIILYAGDDLERVLPIGEKSLLVAGRRKIVIHHKDLYQKGFTHQYISKNAIVLLRKLIEKRGEKPSLKNFDIPFFYVNGNDDEIKKHGKSLYLDFGLPMVCRDGDSHVLVANSKGLICVRKNSGHESYYGNNVKIFCQITPCTQHTVFSKGDEKITVAGTSCPFGCVDEVDSPPVGYADIFLSHLPPYGSQDFSIRFGKEHIGSKKMRAALLEFSPRVMLCGHSHLWGGRKVGVGETTVINVSSHDSPGSDGNYAVIDSKNWSVVLGSIKNNPLSRIPGIKDLGKFIVSHGILDKRLHRYLYKDLPTEYHALMATLNELEKLGIGYATKIKQRTESTRWKRPLIIKKITIDPHKQAFVDVETGLLRGDKPGTLWLVGILLNEKVMQFRIPEETNEFLDYLRKTKILSLASWTDYDQKALSPLLGEAQIKMKFFDACTRARNSIVWHTYKLDSLHKAMFGDNYQTGGLSGLEAGFYADHLIIPNVECEFCPAVEEVANLIMEKNALDLYQMQQICQAAHDHPSLSMSEQTEGGKFL